MFVPADTWLLTPTAENLIISFSTLLLGILYVNANTLLDILPVDPNAGVSVTL